ncbi:unnamed protein product [Moneuplotes crassus]|uniref:Uncharacterized protein n=1 Tax=Euplotes crassus TaxID=5936 RepID=A0AAD1U458_EUPCR|nr:unnamed protein product [Moneuplotes crassus]
MVDLSKKRKRASMVVSKEDISQRAITRNIDRIRNLKKYHRRKRSENQIMLRQAIENNLGQKAPRKLVSSYTKLAPLKLSGRNKKPFSTPNEPESSFTKIKYHTAANTPLRQRPHHLKASPMLPNVRDLLLPPSLTHKNNHATPNREKAHKFFPSSEMRIQNLSLNQDMNMSKNKSNPISSNLSSGDKIVSRNSKPPLSSQTDSKKSLKVKDKACSFSHQNFKIRNDTNCNSLIQSLLRRSAQFRKNVPSKFKLPKLSQNSM